jgi:hypothetical protein
MDKYNELLRANLEESDRDLPDLAHCSYKLFDDAVTGDRKLEEQKGRALHNDALELDISHWQQIRGISEEVVKSGRLVDAAIAIFRKQVEEQNTAGWYTYDANGNEIPISIQYVVDRLNDELEHRKSSFFVTIRSGQEPEFIVGDKQGSSTTSGSSPSL